MEFRHRSRDCKGLRRAAMTLFAGCLATLCLGVLDAGAQSCDAPPGTSGLEEYCESLPAPGGRQGPSDAAPAGPGVSSQTGSSLGAAGSDGETVKRLAEGDDPSGDDRRRSAPATDAREPAAVAIAPPPATEAGAGHSAGLPYAIVLALIVLGVAAAAISARRRRAV